MPRRSTFNPSAPLQTINNTSYLTGESRGAIRKGIKAGRIPHVVRGSGSNAVFLVNLPLYKEMLDAESRASLLTGPGGAGAFD